MITSRPYEEIMDENNTYGTKSRLGENNEEG
jgi:hypothetical protein